MNFLFRKKEKQPIREEEKQLFRPLPNAADKQKHYEIKIFGSGCAKCEALEKAVRSAAQELGLSFTLEHVTDFSQTARLGIMSTPALTVNDTLLSYGKVLSKAEALEILRRI